MRTITAITPIPQPCKQVRKEVAKTMWKAIAPASIPVMEDKPLIPRYELERSLKSLDIRQMTPEERERYGPAVPVKGQPFRMPNKRVKP